MGSGGVGNGLGSGDGFGGGSGKIGSVTGYGSGFVSGAIGSVGPGITGSIGWLGGFVCSLSSFILVYLYMSSRSRQLSVDLEAKQNPGATTTLGCDRIANFLRGVAIFRPSLVSDCRETGPARRVRGLRPYPC